MADMNPINGGLTFAEWMLLAKDDPKLFDQKRKDAAQAFIEKQEKERRLSLQQLQFRIDAICFKYRHNPYLCTQVLISLMWESHFKGCEKCFVVSQALNSMASQPVQTVPRLRIVPKD